VRAESREEDDMLRTILAMTLLATAALASPAAYAAGPREGATQLAKEDKDFLSDAAMGSLYQVKLGQIVSKQAASEDVKRFAQRMVDDHTKVNEKLTELAQKEGVALPQQLDKKHQEMLDKVVHESGPKLERTYLVGAIADQKDDMKAFEHEAKDGKNPAVKQFATTSLPVLEDHLTLARQALDRLNKK
jgi:putative membrane protein